MPGMFGGDNTGPEYAPHMWLDGGFIHNSEMIEEVDGWWYRAGRLADETIVAERWKGSRFAESGRESVPRDQIPEKLVKALETRPSRAEQEAFQQEMELEAARP